MVQSLLFPVVRSRNVFELVEAPMFHGFAISFASKSPCLMQPELCQQPIAEWLRMVRVSWTLLLEFKPSVLGVGDGSKWGTSSNFKLTVQLIC